VLFERFEERLSAMESGSVGGTQKWRLLILARALDAIEDDREAAMKHLEDFDRRPSMEDFASSGVASAKPSLGNMRVRFRSMKAWTTPKKS
jgi:hypothetical protein